MSKTFSELVRRALRPATLALAVLGAACGGEDSDAGSDNRCGFAQPDCLDCAPIGGCCLSSTNCPVATICNLATEPLFDPNSDEGVCLKVTCDSDAECQAPKVCSLEKICRTPVCQVNADCTGGQICVGGACAAAPSASDVASCTVTTRDSAIVQGATVNLAAVARNASGEPLAGVNFTWASSDASVVSVSGNTATGGTMQGTATLSAMAGTTACTGQATLSNFPAPGADARIVVVTDGEGTPLAGATVEIDAGGAQTGTTDMNGSVSFSGLTAPISSVTVSAQNYQVLSVIQPGTNDIFIPLPRQPDQTRAGGFRGVVDISATERGDIQIGFAGPAIPSNLLDFGLDALVGDLIQTEINAPQLGLEFVGMDAVELPGGLLAALGSSRFTADGSGPRCQGASASSTQLGCFLARAPEGLTAGWALAGQLRLRDVTSIATTLSDALSGGGNTEDLPIGDILIAALPLIRNLNHAIVASLEIDAFPLAMDGQADFTRYQRADLQASQGLGVLSVVNVPNLPGPASDCADAAIIVAAANLEGRGLIPLGAAAGLDALAPTDTPDCRIAGIREAFGSGSADTTDGQMALSMAPLHSGAEGGEIFLLLVAADIDKLFSDDGFQATAIVERTPNGVAANQSISGSYLDLPTGTINGTMASIALNNTVSGAILNRYELQGGGRTWLVYAPSSLANVNLPNSAAGRAVTSSLDQAYILSMGMSGQFAELFQFGSGKTLDRLVNVISGFSVQQCATTATAPCQLQ